MGYRGQPAQRLQPDRPRGHHVFALQHRSQSHGREPECHVARAGPRHGHPDRPDRRSRRRRLRGLLPAGTALRYGLAVGVRREPRLRHGRLRADRPHLRDPRDSPRQCVLYRPRRLLLRALHGHRGHRPRQSLLRDVVRRDLQRGRRHRADLLRGPRQRRRRLSRRRGRGHRHGQGLAQPRARGRRDALHQPRHRQYHRPPHHLRLRHPRPHVPPATRREPGLDRRGGRRVDREHLHVCRSCTRGGNRDGVRVPHRRGRAGGLRELPGGLRLRGRRRDQTHRRLH